jgi:hypothetical protein
MPKREMVTAVAAPYDEVRLNVYCDRLYLDGVLGASVSLVCDIDHGESSMCLPVTSKSPREG